MLFSWLSINFWASSRILEEIFIPSLTLIYKWFFKYYPWSQWSLCRLDLLYTNDLVFLISSCSIRSYVHDHYHSSILMILPSLDLIIVLIPMISCTVIACIYRLVEAISTRSPFSVDSHIDIVKTNNTDFDIFDLPNFIKIGSSRPKISCKTHETLVFINISIWITVRNTLIYSIVSYYTSLFTKIVHFYPFSSKSHR